MSGNDVEILNMEHESPINFLGKKRRLGKTNKRISNRITYLLKKENANNRIIDPEEYEIESDEWIKQAGKLVKQIIKPITKEELEFIDVQDLEQIQDAIERRKYKARGYTDQEITMIEEAGRKAMVDQAKRLLVEDDTPLDEDGEDFPDSPQE